jgi:hypothetical protein
MVDGPPRKETLTAMKKVNDKEGQKIEESLQEQQVNNGSIKQGNNNQQHHSSKLKGL